MAQNVFLTRLHVRYDFACVVPEDLMFRKPRIVATIRRAISCAIRGPARKTVQLPRRIASNCGRYEQEAQTLLLADGVEYRRIRHTMRPASLPVEGEEVVSAFVE